MFGISPKAVMKPFDSINSSVRKLFHVTCSIVFFSVFGCSSGPGAEAIVDLAIAAHGGDRYAESHIRFQFRGKTYSVVRPGGDFHFERRFRESGYNVRDVLRGSGFTRYVDGQRVSLSPEDSSRFANSLNSVVYFARLPQPLADEAVQLERLPDVSLRGEPYWVVQVEFSEKQGGEDHEDRYLYWIHRQNHTVDFLAYSFTVNGGGMRFREAVNARTVGGIRFSDYINFRPAEKAVRLVDLPGFWLDDRLDSLSYIALDSIAVKAAAQKRYPQLD